MKIVPKRSVITNEKVCQYIDLLSDDAVYQLFEEGKLPIIIDGALVETLVLNKNAIVKLDWEYVKKDDEDRWILLYRGKKTETLIYMEKGSQWYECKYTDAHYLDVLSDGWIKQPIMLVHLKMPDLTYLQAVMENEYCKWKQYIK